MLVGRLAVRVAVVRHCWFCGQRNWDFSGTWRRCGSRWRSLSFRGIKWPMFRASWRSWLTRRTTSTCRREKPTYPTCVPTTRTTSRPSSMSTRSTWRWWRNRSDSKSLRWFNWVGDFFETNLTKGRSHGEQGVANGPVLSSPYDGRGQIRTGSQRGAASIFQFWSGVCGFDSQSCHFFLFFLNFLRQPFNRACFFEYFINEWLWDWFRGRNEIAHRISRISYRFWLKIENHTLL